MTEHNGTRSVRRQKVKADYSKKKFVFFLIMTAVFMAVVTFADKISPYDSNAQIFLSLQSPCRLNLLGTDKLGRDMLSRVLVGLRTSVFSALVLVLITVIFGTFVGVVCGMYGGAVDSAMMRICDICLAFPGIVFALGIAALLGGGLINAVISLAVVSWPKYARLARSQTLSLKEADFIAAARLSGDSSLQIVLRHILPNIADTIMVNAVQDIGTMMTEIAGLSFLGLGAMPPTAELGSMMSDGRSMLQTYPWVIISPGVAIFVAVSIFNLLGDAFRDFLDPKGRNKGR